MNEKRLELQTKIIAIRLNLMLEKNGFKIEKSNENYICEHNLYVTKTWGAKKFVNTKKAAIRLFDNITKENPKKIIFFREIMPNGFLTKYYDSDNLILKGILGYEFLKSCNFLEFSVIYKIER